MSKNGDKTQSTEAEARWRNPLRTTRIGGVLFGARRSDDGLWCKPDGTLLPWACWLPWHGPEGGGKLKIGAWIISAMWEKSPT